MRDEWAEEVDVKVGVSIVLLLGRDFEHTYVSKFLNQMFGQAVLCAKERP